MISSLEGSPVFNPILSASCFSLDPYFQELNIVEVNLVWCGFSDCSRKLVNLL